MMGTRCVEAFVDWKCWGFQFTVRKATFLQFTFQIGPAVLWIDL